ncbi:PD-(D/E)XK motif protein [Deinococcus xianganensis]|uniref:PD-(D/E)XK motif protein n=1 Tax=Deinococcus xianganensis TaxID=1507289 RepID=A0A6I4YE19_9DEIO|nr:PD-(D/E)XK motif protein [Deinococcus xianganensis]MXV19178.1 PD-(D/E)XK motif protein [Deinococcus xianganensis]
MQAGADVVMRASLTLGGGVTLLCLRGGVCGEGELALRLPLETDVHRLLESWIGLKLERNTGDPFPGQQVIRIAPADTGYRDIYSRLADDIHDHLQDVAGGDTVVRTLLARLRLWSSFLRRSGGVPDGRTVRGLFAELSALEQFLVPAVGWATALGLWTGPSGTPQDITGDRLAMDVKATQVGDQLVTISSIEQLDPPGTRAVRLLQAQLSEGDGESLQALVSRLQILADAAGAGHMFAARIDRVGMTAQALDALFEQPMQVLSWVLHRADDPGFPALRRTALPSGIVNASYRIDLSRSTATPADLSELPALLVQTPPGEGA